MFDCLIYGQHILKQFKDFNSLIIFVMITMEGFLRVEKLIITVIFIHFRFFIALVLIKVGVELILFLFYCHFGMIIAFYKNYLAVLCHIVNCFGHLKFELSSVYEYCFSQSDPQLFLFCSFYPSIFLLKCIKQLLELNILNEFK